MAAPDAEASPRRPITAWPIVYYREEHTDTGHLRAEGGALWPLLAYVRNEERTTYDVRPFLLHVERRPASQSTQVDLVAGVATLKHGPMSWSLVVRPYLMELLSKRASPEQRLLALNALFMLFRFELQNLNGNRSVQLRLRPGLLSVFWEEHEVHSSSAHRFAAQLLWRLIFAQRNHDPGSAVHDLSWGINPYLLHWQQTSSPDNDSTRLLALLGLLYYRWQSLQGEAERSLYVAPLLWHRKRWVGHAEVSHNTVLVLPLPYWSSSDAAESHLHVWPLFGVDRYADRVRYSSLFPVLSFERRNDGTGRDVWIWPVVHFYKSNHALQHHILPLYRYASSWPVSSEHAPPNRRLLLFVPPTLVNSSADELQVTSLPLIHYRRRHSPTDEDTLFVVVPALGYYWWRKQPEVVEVAVWPLLFYRHKSRDVQRLWCALYLALDGRSADERQHHHTRALFPLGALHRSERAEIRLLCPLLFLDYRNLITGHRLTMVTPLAWQSTGNSGTDVVVLPLFWLRKQTDGTQYLLVPLLLSCRVHQPGTGDYWYLTPLLSGAQWNDPERTSHLTLLPFYRRAWCPALDEQSGMFLSLYFWRVHRNIRTRIFWPLMAFDIADPVRGTRTSSFLGPLFFRDVTSMHSYLILGSPLLYTRLRQLRMNRRLRVIASVWWDFSRVGLEFQMLFPILFHYDAQSQVSPRIWAVLPLGLWYTARGTPYIQLILSPLGTYLDVPSPRGNVDASILVQAFAPLLFLRLILGRPEAPRCQLMTMGPLYAELCLRNRVTQRPYLWFHMLTPLLFDLVRTSDADQDPERPILRVRGALPLALQVETRTYSVVLSPALLGGRVLRHRDDRHMAWALAGLFFSDDQPAKQQWIRAALPLLLQFGSPLGRFDLLLPLWLRVVSAQSGSGLHMVTPLFWSTWSPSRITRLAIPFYFSTQPVGEVAHREQAAEEDGSLPYSLTLVLPLWLSYSQGRRRLDLALVPPFMLYEDGAHGRSIVALFPLLYSSRDDTQGDASFYLLNLYGSSTSQRTRTNSGYVLFPLLSWSNTTSSGTPDNSWHYRIDTIWPMFQVQRSSSTFSLRALPLLFSVHSDADLRERHITSPLVIYRSASPSGGASSRLLLLPLLMFMHWREEQATRRVSSTWLASAYVNRTSTTGHTGPRHRLSMGVVPLISVVSKQASDRRHLRVRLLEPLVPGYGVIGWQWTQRDGAASEVRHHSLLGHWYERSAQHGTQASLLWLGHPRFAMAAYRQSANGEQVSAHIYPLVDYQQHSRQLTISALYVVLPALAMFRYELTSMHRFIRYALLFRDEWRPYDDYQDTVLLWLGHPALSIGRRWRNQQQLMLRLSPLFFYDQNSNHTLWRFSLGFLTSLWPHLALFRIEQPTARGAMAARGRVDPTVHLLPLLHYHQSPATGRRELSLLWLAHPRLSLGRVVWDPTTTLIGGGGSEKLLRLLPLVYAERTQTPAMARVAAQDYLTLAVGYALLPWLSFWYYRRDVLADTVASHMLLLYRYERVGEQAPVIPNGVARLQRTELSLFWVLHGALSLFRYERERNFLSHSIALLYQWKQDVLGDYRELTLARFGAAELSLFRYLRTPRVHLNRLAPLYYSHYLPAEQSGQFSMLWLGHPKLALYSRELYRGKSVQRLLPLYYVQSDAEHGTMAVSLLWMAHPTLALFRVHWTRKQLYSSLCPLYNFDRKLVEADGSEASLSFSLLWVGWQNLAVVHWVRTIAKGGFSWLHVWPLFHYAHRGGLTSRRPLHTISLLWLGHPHMSVLRFELYRRGRSLETPLVLALPPSLPEGSVAAPVAIDTSTSDSTSSQRRSWALWLLWGLLVRLQYDAPSGISELRLFRLPLLIRFGGGMLKAALWPLIRARRMAADRLLSISVLYLIIYGQRYSVAQFESSPQRLEHHILPLYSYLRDEGPGHGSVAKRRSLSVLGRFFQLHQEFGADGTVMRERVELNPLYYRELDPRTGAYSALLGGLLYKDSGKGGSSAINRNASWHWIGGVPVLSAASVTVSTLVLGAAAAAALVVSRRWR